MTSEDPAATSPVSPEDEFVTQMLASLRDNAPIPSDVAARLDVALTQERLESGTDLGSVDELARRRDVHDRRRSWLIGLGAAAALIIAIPTGLSLLNHSTSTTAVTADSAAAALVGTPTSTGNAVTEPVTASGTAYSAQSLKSQVLTLVAAPRSLTTQSAEGGVDQPTDLMAPHSARSADVTFAADASALARCLDALTTGTTLAGVQPRAIDIGTYAGGTAVVVVYLRPDLGPFAHWQVWVVNPTCSDPGRLLFSSAFLSP